MNVLSGTLLLFSLLQGCSEIDESQLVDRRSGSSYESGQYKSDEATPDFSKEGTPQQGSPETIVLEPKAPGNSQTPTPPVDPDPTETPGGGMSPEETEIPQQNLYVQFCQNCHDPLPNSKKLDSSVEDIAYAIDMVPKMQHLSFLTPMQIETIAGLLRTKKALPPDLPDPNPSMTSSPPPPPPMEDKTPPGIVQNLVCTAGGSQLVQLSWDPAVETQSLPVKYRIFRDAIPIGETSDTEFSDYGFEDNVMESMDDDVSDLNPKAFFTFDSGTANSDHGNYPGELKDGARIENVPFAEEDNQAAVFDGVNDSIGIGPMDVSGNQLSLFAHIRPTAFSTGDARIVAKATGTATNDHYYMISTLNDGGKMVLRVRLKVNGNTSTFIADQRIQQNQWTHVGFVYNGSQIRLYQDGSLVLSESLSGILSTNSSVPTAIGASPLGPGKHFTGAIDNVGIFDRALSTAEISSLNLHEFAQAPERISNLEPMTSYDYHVIASDNKENQAPKSATVSVTTLAAPDKEAPTVPNNLEAQALGPMTVQLSWNPSTDDQTGVKNYEIYRDDKKIAQVNTHQYKDENLAPATFYQYQVLAVDNADNRSEKSSASFVSTEVLNYNGAELYSMNCQSCHGPRSSSSKKGRSADKIYEAIFGPKSVPKMRPLQNQLNREQIDAIAGTLRDNEKPEDLLQCNKRGEAKKNPLRRLTFQELRNTIQASFPSAVFNAISSTIQLFPQEAASEKLGSFENNVDSSHTTSLTEVALMIGKEVAKQKNSAISSCGGGAISTACFSQYLDGLGEKLLRRPLTSSESSSALALFTAQEKKDEGIAISIASLMLSPYFLFHMEMGTSQSGNEVTLTQWEVAARISYQATGFPPDAVLLDAARNGQLANQSQVVAQTGRLLRSDKGKAHVQEFFDRWLNVGAIPKGSFPTAFLNGIDVSDLHSEAIEELRNFVIETVYGAKSYKDLIMSKNTYAKSTQLANIYGTSVWNGGNPPLTGQERGGLLGRVALNLSDTESTHIIGRGVRVVRRILCETLEDPDEVLLAQRSDQIQLDPKDYSHREVVAALTQPAPCMACHSVVNPIGFSLENLDSLGRWRTSELVYNDAGVQIASHPIDASGSLEITTGVPVHVDSPAKLAAQIATNAKGPACFSRQFFRFANYRQEDEKDNCQLLDTTKPLIGVGSLFEAIVNTIANDGIFSRKVD